MMTLTRILAPLWQQWRLWLGVQTLLQPWDRWIPTVSVSGKRWGHLVPWLLHPWRAEICQDVKSILQMWGTDGNAFSYGIDFLDDSLPALESECHRLKYIREVHCEIMENLRDPYMSLETCPWFPDSWGRGVLWLEIWWASLMSLGS